MFNILGGSFDTVFIQLWKWEYTTTNGSQSNFTFYLWYILKRSLQLMAVCYF